MATICGKASSSPLEAKVKLNAIRKRNNETGNFKTQLHDVISRQLRFPNRIESCLAVGAGSGDLDLEFIQNFTPDLRTLIAVEPDAASADVLRSRVEERMPNVALEVFPGKMEDWDGLDHTEHPVDMVLMFLSLYYVSSSEHSRILTSLFQKVVKAGGYVAVLLSDGLEQLKKDAAEFIQQLNPELIDANLTSDAVTQQMTSLGFVPYYEHTYKLVTNTEGMESDEGVIDYVHQYIKSDVSLEHLRQTFGKFVKNMANYEEKRQLSVFQKP